MYIKTQWTDKTILDTTLDSQMIKQIWIKFQEWSKENKDTVTMLRGEELKSHNRMIRDTYVVKLQSM